MAVFTPISTLDPASKTTAILDALFPATPGLTFDPGTLAIVSGPTSIGLYDGSLSALGIGAGLLLTSGTMPGTTNTVGYFGLDNGMVEILRSMPLCGPSSTRRRSMRPR